MRSTDVVETVPLDNAARPRSDMTLQQTRLYTIEPKIRRTAERSLHGRSD